MTAAAEGGLVRTSSGAGSDRLALGLTSRDGQALLLPFAQRIEALTYLDFDLPMRGLTWRDVRLLVEDFVSTGGSLHFNLQGIDGAAAALSGCWNFESLTERELAWICSSPDLLAITTFYGTDTAYWQPGSSTTCSN